MKTLTLLILCVCFMGCRCILYVAVGPQSFDKVEIVNQRADPNMADYEGVVGAAVGAAVKVGGGI